MSPLAVFGITSDGANLVVNLLLLFLVVFWIALVYWTFADARRRIADPMLVGCATAAAMFPFAGTLVYVIVRPPEYLHDVRERELEIAAAEVRLAAIENLTCPHCNFRVEGAFLRCPSCLRRLKEPCATCHKPLDPSWKICPYCESEIGQPAAQPRRRARPRERPAAPAPAPQVAAPEARPRQAAPAADRQRPAARAERRTPSDGARTPPPASRPAASTGEGQRQRASSGGSQRPAKQPARNSSSPAADRPKQREPRPSRAADGSPRPPTREDSGRAAGRDRQKRPAAPTGKRPATKAASDAVTAEQPVARPRTRPPSAG
jgi:hypothetical protein